MSGRFLVLLVFFSGWLTAIGGAWIESTSHDRFLNDAAAIQVVLPDSPPQQDQEAINLAMVAYNIKSSRNMRWPEFDENMRDRGLTVRGPWLQDSYVAVGPAAFDSWALLGSTLGHEIEVHCEQNFPLITLMDFIGLGGTIAAERQAYVYELANSRRFGLAEYDRSLVEATMTYYYPESNGFAWFSARGFRMPTDVSKWLAAQILPTVRP